MRQAFYILLGSGMTIAAAFALGMLLMRRLSLKLFRQEELLFAFVSGSAMLSFIVFLIAAMQAVHKGVIVAVAAASIAAMIWTKSHRSDAPPFPPLSRMWKVLFWIPFAAFGVVYFFNAMAPEHSPDGITYHLGLVSRYYRQHGLSLVDTNMYASLSQAMEMLFLFAFAFGKHSAAALVHCGFLFALPLLMLSWGRRFGQTPAAITGAVLVYVSPVVGITGTSAYNDVAAATAIFAVFYLLQIWTEQRDPKLLMLIGLLAGFCYALKYTAGVAIPFALAWVAWKSRSARAVAVTAACALLLVVPWMAKDAVLIGNPVAPFFNKYFPNPYMLPGDEASYAQMMRTFNEVQYREIPKEVTINGARLGGLLGPVFLLTPFALLALRWRQGRAILLAAVIFSLVYFTNISTRFLILSAPFWALALGMVVSQIPPLTALLVLVHCVLSWPSIIPRYAQPYAWRLEKIPLRQALRIVSEDYYLSMNSRAYVLARMVEKQVPSNGRVFSFGGPIGEAYTSRDTIVSFQGAGNLRLRDLLLTPLIKEYQATRWETFAFSPATATAVRLVQTASRAPEYWSVSELRVFAGDHELERRPEWRLTASPNPWAVQSAFDNSPVTRWRSGESLRSGMYLQIDFGRPETFDKLRVESSTDQYAVRMRVEVRAADGKWHVLDAKYSEAAAPEWGGLRRAATREVKAAGVAYLLIDEGDFEAQEYIGRAPLWGLRLLDNKAGAFLYHIE